MNLSVISDFFESEPETIRDASGVEHAVFYHKGTLLNYELMFTPSREWLAISGDPKTPFSGTSFYEFYLTCDHVTRIPAHNSMNPGLAFYPDEEASSDKCAMTLYMRKDRDLTVWPRETHQKKYEVEQTR